MSINVLDEQTALIVIDLQTGTVANPTAHPSGQVVARAGELLSAFRQRELLVVLSMVDGTPPGRTHYGEGARHFPPDWNELLPELDRQPQDVAVVRRTWSAFAGTDLSSLLTERGVTQVVLAGMATSFGVESTARDAYDLGYSVTLAIDAMTDPNLDAHFNSVSRVFPALGQTASASEIIALLEGR
jgi:nicotinamidase-related amidase